MDHVNVPISVMAGVDWKPLKVGDKEYKVAQLTAVQIGKLEAWAKNQFPDPRKVAMELIEGLPVELARDVVSRAEERMLNPRWCFGTEGYFQLMRSTDGMVETLSHTLKKYHPELTRTDIEKIVEDIGNTTDDESKTSVEIADELQSAALGEERSLIEGFGDPKAMAATQD